MLFLRRRTGRISCSAMSNACSATVKRKLRLAECWITQSNRALCTKMRGATGSSRSTGITIVFSMKVRRPREKPEGSAVILVVDDEPIVLGVLCGVLRLHGYDV